MTDTRTIGRYAHPSRLAAQPVTVAREDWRAKVDEPLFMFFDGQSFKAISTQHGRGSLDLFSNYGITGAVLRPSKLQQNDWDFARAAVQCEYAFRAIEMVASDISAIPHGVKRRSTGELWPDHPLMQALAWARRTLSQDVMSLWQKSRFVFGENYLYPISNGWTLPGQTQPYYNGIQWLNPLVMEPVIQYSQLVGYDYTAYGMDRLQKHEVVLDKVSSMFDDLRGQSLISTALESINITIQVKRFTLDSFIKELRMQGVITGRQGSNLTTQDITKVVEQMKQEQESRLIGIPYPVEYTPIQHKWDDTQFKASEEALRAIAAALGIPLSVLGAWFSATYQSAPAQIEFYQNMVIFRECDRLKLFIDDVLMPYYDPAGEGEWYYDKDAALALSEDKKAKSELIRGEWKDGLRTMNAARAALKMDPVPGGDVFMINGQLIQESMLAQMATQPAPLPLDTLPNAAAPQLPAPAPEKAVEPTEQPGMKSAFIGLTFPNHPDLIGLQNRVKQIVGEGQCSWNAPDDFHITLMYAPAVTDEQLSGLAEALDEIDVPEMALRVGSLGVFDNVGEHAVHFKLRRNGDLLDLQAELHDLAVELGIPMSSYSDPAQYKPHITMGYSTDKLKPVTFNSKLSLKAATFCLKSGDEVLYERPLGDTPKPDDPEPDPEPEPPAQKMIVVEGSDPTEPVTLEVVDPALPVQTEMIVEDEEPDWAYTTFRDGVKTIEGDALAELDKWQKKAKNAGATKAADDFITYLIRDEIAEGVRLALREAGDDKAAVKTVFENARALISYKAVQATRVDFEDGFQAILNDALAGKTKRSRWSTLTRSLISTSINKAYRDGLADGGVLDEPDADEQAAIDRMIADQSAYVTNLGNTLFKSEDMISEDMAAQKPAMWWNGSIAPAYSAGLLSADANSMFTWQLGNTEKHCEAEGGKWGCANLAGTTKRYKTWDKLKLIAGTVGQDTTCGGYKCDCKLKRKAAKSSPGVLLDWQEYEHLHSDDVKPQALQLPTVGSEEDEHGNPTA